MIRHNSTRPFALTCCLLLWLLLGCRGSDPDVAPAARLTTPPTTAGPTSETGACLNEGNELVQFVDESVGISFCYPAGWVVEDDVADSGFYELSPDGEGWGSSQVVLIYPHETVDPLVQFFTGTDEPDQLAIVFFLDVVRDAEPVGDPLIVEEESLSRTTLHGSGTVDGQPVYGVLSGVRQNGVSAMSITYIFDPDISPTIADQIAASITPLAARVDLSGERTPLALNEPVEGAWGRGEPQQYALTVQSVAPLLVVAEADRETVVDIYSADGLRVRQFDTATIGGPTGRGDITEYSYGYRDPNAIVLTPDAVGEYIFRVGSSEATSGSGHYRLAIYELGSDAAAVQSREQFTVAAGTTNEHIFTMQADRPLLILAELASEDGELRLATFDQADQIHDSRPLEPWMPGQLLQWLPRTVEQMRLEVREEGGSDTAYILTALAVPGTGRSVIAPTYPAFADTYSATLDLRENGDVAIVEEVTLTLNESVTELRWSWNQLYREAISNLVLETDRGACRPQENESGLCSLEAAEGALQLRWPVEGQPGSQHTFRIEYLVGDAFDPGADAFTWNLLPASRTFGLGVTSITVLFPEETAIGYPQFEDAQGAAIVDSQLGFSDGGVTYVAYRLTRDLPPHVPVNLRIPIRR